MFVNALLVVALAAITALAIEPKDLLVDREDGKFERPERDSLCPYEDKRISRISTMKTLLEMYHMGRYTEAPCRDHWKGAMEDMEDILTASDKDACSMKTVAQIERFHWRYLFRDLARSHTKRAPKIPVSLKMFFLHFVEQTLDKCQSTLGERLKRALSDNLGADLEAESLTSGGSWGAPIDAMAGVSIPKSKMKNFDDFYLIHLVSKTSARKETGSIWNTLRMRDVTYGAFRVLDPSVVVEARKRCISEARPLYFNTVFPVMRLIDLGYGQKDTPLPSDHKELIVNWYKITELCQLIIPISFKEDTEGGVKGKYTERDADYEDYIGVMPADVSVSVKLDGDVIAAATDDKALDRVKSNFKSRNSYYTTMMKNKVYGLGSKLSGMFTQ